MGDLNRTEVEYRDQVLDFSFQCKNYARNGRNFKVMFKLSLGTNLWYTFSRGLCSDMEIKAEKIKILILILGFRRHLWFDRKWILSIAPLSTYQILAKSDNLRPSYCWVNKYLRPDFKRGDFVCLCAQTWGATYTKFGALEHRPFISTPNARCRFHIRCFISKHLKIDWVKNRGKIAGTSSLVKLAGEMGYDVCLGPNFLYTILLAERRSAV